MAYSPEEIETIWGQIIDLLSDGMSYRQIRRELGAPEYHTIQKWMIEDPEKLQQYARAKEESADSDADDISFIADEVLKGTYDPQAARVAIDAKKWIAGKKKPKKYGDKLDLNHSGKVEVEDLSKLSTEELAERAKLVKTITNDKA